MYEFIAIGETTIDALSVDPEEVCAECGDVLIIEEDDDSTEVTADEEGG